MSYIDNLFINKKYHINAFNTADCISGYPIIKPVNYIPQKMLGIDCISKSKNFDETLHTFIFDKKLETIWHNFENDKYISRIAKFPAVLTPDFSAYLDMPVIYIEYNVKRSFLVGQYWQKRGLTVIPVAIWAAPNTYNICFNIAPILI